MVGKLIGLFLHPQNLVPVCSSGFFELGDFDFAIIQKTLRVLDFEMQVQGGVAKVDFVTVALIAGRVFAVTRLSTLLSPHFGVILLGIRCVTAHLTVNKRL